MEVVVILQELCMEGSCDYDLGYRAVGDCERLKA